jgi:hypothetical protein
MARKQSLIDLLKRPSKDNRNVAVLSHNKVDTSDIFRPYRNIIDN